MTLDRRIRIEYDVSTTQAGQWDPQPDWRLLATVWATRRDLDGRDIIQEEGVSDEYRRDWRIRWRADIATTAIFRMRVIDGSTTFNVTRMIEETSRGRDRRRWLRLQGVGSNALVEG